jgi:crotonobetainyl-CoA:carnitine CoA-transferase CaiB-like acyl-CoA transferase
MTTGMYAAMGILGALYARERTGQGDFLDLALFDSQLTWLANIGSNYLNAGESPTRWGNAHPSIVPYQLFQGNDGRFFVVGVGTQEQWLRLVKLLGMEPELSGDGRFASNALRIENREELIPMLQKRFDVLSSTEWLAKLAAADVPASAIRTVGEALSDSQGAARRLIVEIEHPTLQKARSIANPVRYAGQPVAYRLPPPLLGEHSREVLEGLKYTQTEVEQAMRGACVTRP